MAALLMFVLQAFFVLFVLRPLVADKLGLIPKR